MKRKFSLWLLTAISLGLSCCASKEQADLLIVNATIVDVESGNVLSDRLVMISGDTIRAVEETNKRDQYEASQIVDAAGRYVMPGLWDMHVHFRGGDTLIEENKDMLPLFLAHGITTVRDAGGDITPAVLRWREDIRSGELEGPTIFTSGPKLDGPDPAWDGSIRVSDQEDIEAALDSLESIGADYVKMYDGSLTKEAFYGIIQAAEKRNLKTTGHMPLTADILEAIDHGLDGSEHLYYILKACSPLADSLTEVSPGYGMMDEIIETYNEELAAEVFEKLRQNEVYVTPTLHIGKTLAEILDVDHSKDDLLPYIGKGIQKTYEGRIEGARRARERGNSMRERMEEKTMEMMVPMYDAGVKLVAGSDCGAYNSYVYPGGSLHGEFARFADSGLSPQQILTTSFIYGPEFFGLENHYGSVEGGRSPIWYYWKKIRWRTSKMLRESLQLLKEQNFMTGRNWITYFRICRNNIWLAKRCHL